MMHKTQEQVREFHLTFDHPAPDGPTNLDNFRAELRARLVLEEALEFVRACGFTVTVNDSRPITHPNDLRWTKVALPDWEGIIDASADINYVTYGAYVEMGNNAEIYADEVHRSNMAKKGGTKDANGKTLKPAGWTPPDIKGLLQKEIFEYRAKLEAQFKVEP